MQSVILTSTDGTKTELLSSPVLAFVDSTVPNIYLSSDTCNNFEEALGLHWNSSWGTYLLNDSTHNHLMTKVSTITFLIGNNQTSSPTVNITMPYASFDLTATPPLVSTPTRYFPLKRAKDETQFTLGRVFLQEA